MHVVADDCQGGWSDGWVDGWMNGWIDGRVDGWVHGWMVGLVDGYSSPGIHNPLPLEGQDSTNVKKLFHINIINTFLLDYYDVTSQLH